MTTSAHDSADDKATVLLFTWNLDQEPGFVDLALKYLTEQGSFIAALQEVPKDDNEPRSSIEYKANELGLRILNRRVPKFDGDLIGGIDPKCWLLASDDIAIDIVGRAHEYTPSLDDARRAEGLTVRSRNEEWGNLRVLGIHAWDRRSHPSEYQRGIWANRMRDILDDFWKNNEPLVVIGDLNADPWSTEITERTGLYAIRRKDWPKDDDNGAKQPGRDTRAMPLYNPMWNLLPDGPEPKGETFFYAQTDLRWRCVDQIILSDHFFDYSSSPTIITSLGGTLLVNKNGRPPPGQHLPVQMKLELGKVASCKISKAF